MRFARLLPRRRSAHPSTGGHELRYWRETGLAKGTAIYAEYLRLFELDPESLRGQRVADYGCGPFGGVLVALVDVEPVPIDVLAHEYNELGRSPWPILPVDDGRIPLDDASCDACFCTNALDHVDDPAAVAAELGRIVKPGGRLFLHVHLRRPDQLNKAHRYVVTEDHVRSWLEPYFAFERVGTGPDWPNEEADLTMLYSTLTRLPQAQ